MKHTKIETVTEERTHAKYTCDLCGHPCGEDYRSGSWDVEETTIACRTGESYPEGGQGDETSVDCCAEVVVSRAGLDALLADADARLAAAVRDLRDERDEALARVGELVLQAEREDDARGDGASHAEQVPPPPGQPGPGRP